MDLRIQAKLRFLTPDEGGRKHAPGCGLAQPCNFAQRRDEWRRPIFNDCFVLLEGHKHKLHQSEVDHSIPLGEEIDAELIPLFPELVREHARVGDEFEVWSPIRVHARGTIVDIEEAESVRDEYR